MNNELYHYGVLGMRWGVRRSKTGSRSSISKPKRSKRTVNESYKQAHSKKKLKYMSNNELQEINKRLNLEKNYKELTRKKRKGKAAVNNFVSTAGTIAAVAGAYNTYKKYVGPILKKVGNLKA